MPIESRDKDLSPVELLMTGLYAFNVDFDLIRWLELKREIGQAADEFVRKLNECEKLGVHLDPPIFESFPSTPGEPQRWRLVRLDCALRMPDWVKSEFTKTSPSRDKGPHT